MEAFARRGAGVPAAEVVVRGFVFPARALATVFTGVTEFLLDMGLRAAILYHGLGMTRRNVEGPGAGSLGRVHWIYEIYGGTNGRYVDFVEGRVGRVMN